MNNLEEAARKNGLKVDKDGSIYEQGRYSKRIIVEDDKIRNGTYGGVKPFNGSNFIKAVATAKGK